MQRSNDIERLQESNNRANAINTTPESIGTNTTNATNVTNANATTTNTSSTNNDEINTSNTKSYTIRPMIVASILTAIAVVGSLVSFPVLGAKCAPIQHFVNIIAAIILGPSWAFKAALLAATIRNLLGLGTLFAFPGSIFGALLAGVLYKKTKNVLGAYIGEVFGTAIIGGLVAYPMATVLMNSFKGALFGFVPPFFISTAGGTILAIIIVTALRKKRVVLEQWINQK